ncbi:type II secretion system F family protein [Agromyces fucosus]|uniref:Type II secretion system F family protein n=2 Tax=Agromyces fucosus TaxID=41985 RepID=A0A4Q2JRT0_9MICO|nr:type II secretion system F family protein [Agromyces fucosus]
MPVFIMVVGLLSAAAFGVFVFLLFPATTKAPVPATEASEIEQPTAVPVQQSTIGTRFVAAAPKGYIAWIERQILHAGRPAGWTVARILVWKVVLTAIAVIFGWMFVVSGGVEPFKVLVAVVLVAIAFALPDVLINSRAHDRQTAINNALPDTLDQMTIAVEAGLGFDAAMAKSARNGKGPLAEELIRVLQDMSIGRTRRDAFLELDHRTNSVDLKRFVRAVVQADAYGIALGDVLRVQAGEMRLKRRQRAEEQAQKVTVKILFPLIFCLLPVLLIVVMAPAVIGIMDAFSQVR